MRIRASLILVSIGFVLAASSFYVPAPMLTSALNTTVFKTSEDYTRCDVCHAQEQEEFSRTDAHKTLKCTSCHTISDFGPDLYTHNATTYECVYCHAGAGTGMQSDAHSNMTNASNSTDIFTGSNKACVMCHTKVGKEIEWHRYTGMFINATIDSNGTLINISVSP